LRIIREGQMMVGISPLQGHEFVLFTGFGNLSSSLYVLDFNMYVKQCCIQLVASKALLNYKII
jgi:hypothetical protein